MLGRDIGFEQAGAQADGLLIAGVLMLAGQRRGKAFEPPDLFLGRQIALSATSSMARAKA